MIKWSFRFTSQVVWPWCLRRSTEQTDWCPPMKYSPLRYSLKMLHGIKGKPKQKIIGNLYRNNVQWNPSWNTPPSAITAWSFKTGGLWRQVQLYCNKEPAWNIWSFRTGGLSWQVVSQDRFHCIGNYSQPQYYTLKLSIYIYYEVKLLYG